MNRDIGSRFTSIPVVEDFLASASFIDALKVDRKGKMITAENPNGLFALLNEFSDGLCWAFNLPIARVRRNRSADM
jgi:hypothetical protein